MTLVVKQAKKDMTLTNRLNELGIKVLQIVNKPLTNAEILTEAKRLGLDTELRDQFEDFESYKKAANQRYITYTTNNPKRSPFIFVDNANKGKKVYLKEEYLTKESYFDTKDSFDNKKPQINTKKFCSNNSNVKLSNQKNNSLNIVNGTIEAYVETRVKEATTQLENNLKELLKTNIAAGELNKDLHDELLVLRQKVKELESTLNNKVA